MKLKLMIQHFNLFMPLTSRDFEIFSFVTDFRNSVFFACEICLFKRIYLNFTTTVFFPKLCNLVSISLENKINATPLAYGFGNAFWNITERPKLNLYETTFNLLLNETSVLPFKLEQNLIYEMDGGISKDPFEIYTSFNITSCINFCIPSSTSNVLDVDVQDVDVQDVDVQDVDVQDVDVQDVDVQDVDVQDVDVQDVDVQDVDVQDVDVQDVDVQEVQQVQSTSDEISIECGQKKKNIQKILKEILTQKKNPTIKEKLNSMKLQFDKAQLITLSPPQYTSSISYSMGVNSEHPIQSLLLILLFIFMLLFRQNKSKITKNKNLDKISLK